MSNIVKFIIGILSLLLAASLALNIIYIPKAKIVSENTTEQIQTSVPETTPEATIDTPSEEVSEKVEIKEVADSLSKDNQ